MKRIIMTVVAAMLACGMATAQEGQPRKKVAEDLGGAMSIISQIVDVNCKNKYDENLAITDLHFQVNTKGYGLASIRLPELRVRVLSSHPLESFLYAQGA